MSESEGIMRVGFSIMAEWYCVPVDATDEDVARHVLEHGGKPDDVEDVDLIADRLYGGFTCNEWRSDRRHVCFAAGQYSYTLGANTPLDKCDREKWWDDVIEQSAETGPFIGGGPCCDDAPRAALRKAEGRE